MRDIDKYTQEYSKAGFEKYQVAYRRRKLLEIINKYLPQRILEIGCGMEPLFSYIGYGYEFYYVIEPSKTFFDNAQILADGKNVVCYNDFFYPTKELADKKFDFILCSSLLHELEQPEELLKGILEISDINTIIHFNVPNADSLHRLVAVNMGLILDKHELSDKNILYQQNMVYDLNMLISCLKKSGFTILDKGSYFVKPFSHDQMYQMLKENIINDEVMDGLYKLANDIPEYGSEIFVNCKVKV